MEKKISLSGVKPSGTPHVGNYLGMIKPALEMVKEYQAIYFIADYHALTTVRDGKELRFLSYEVAVLIKNEFMSISNSRCIHFKIASIRL